MIRYSKKVFITKYALTEGIFSMTAEIVGGKYTGGMGWYGPGDWHETKEAALKKVSEMIATKRKSLAKTEARLTKLEEALADGQVKIKER